MGWPKGKKRNNSNTVKTDNVYVSVTKNPKIQAASRSGKSVDPIKEKDEEIAQERQKFITKTKPGKELFPVQVTGMDEKLNWFSQAMATYFGFPQCGFTDGIRRWDFPHAIGNKFKRHMVFRKYAYNHIMVDAFEKGTPKNEILRIKAHLEKLGFTYTYVIAGEPSGVPMEEWIKMVFTSRMKKSSDAILNKVKVPQNLEEANFSGHASPTR